MRYLGKNEQVLSLKNRVRGLGGTPLLKYIPTSAGKEVKESRLLKKAIISPSSSKPQARVFLHRNILKHKGQMAK